MTPPTSPAAMLTTVAEVLGVVPPAVAPHPRDVLGRFRGTLVELEIEVARWELSGSAANDDPAEEVQRAVILALRRLVTLGLAVGVYRPKHQFPEAGERATDRNTNLGKHR